MIAIAACGFPDVTFGPENAGGTEAGANEGSAPDSTTSAVDSTVTPRPDAPSDAPIDAHADASAEVDADAGAGTESDADAGPPPVIIDGSTLDALVVDDAGGQVDASGCVACDCDNDTFDRAGCGAGSGPFDCDDNDTRYKPYQGYLADKPVLPKTGDWDCSGTVEKLFVENVNCGAISIASLLGGKTCADIFGFQQPLACGEPGTWIRCKKPSALALNCAVDDSQTKLETQRCH
jgi:hypothetical protein